jgi:16S rRNA G966 N2-methylase RsmD
VNSDVLKFISSATRTWDYIFADPPYDMKGIGEFPGFILQSNVLTDTGFFVLEHISTLNFSALPAFKESRNYGQSVFSFFSQGS